MGRVRPCDIPEAKDDSQLFIKKLDASMGIVLVHIGKRYLTLANCPNIFSDRMVVDNCLVPRFIGRSVQNCGVFFSQRIPRMLCLRAMTSPGTTVFPHEARLEGAGMLCATERQEVVNMHT